jgi:hypothetical protein
LEAFSNDKNVNVRHLNNTKGVKTGMFLTLPTIKNIYRRFKLFAAWSQRWAHLRQLAFFFYVWNQSWDMFPNLIQFSYKISFEWVGSKREVRFWLHFFFWLNMFFVFVASKVGSTFVFAIYRTESFSKSQNSILSSKAIVLRKFVTTHPPNLQVVSFCHHSTGIMPLKSDFTTTYQPSKWWRNIDLFPKWKTAFLCWNKKNSSSFNRKRNIK